MGVINHNGIFAVTFDAKEFQRLVSWITRNYPQEGIGSLFSCKESLENSYQTIAMFPDGSREGCDLSNLVDKARDDFIAELKKADFVDGSSPWSYIEVGFGGYGQKVLKGNNRNRYSNKSYEEEMP